MDMLFMSGKLCGPNTRQGCLRGCTRESPAAACRFYVQRTGSWKYWESKSHKECHLLNRAWNQAGFKQKKRPFLFSQLQVPSKVFFKLWMWMSQKTCNAFCNLCRNHCVETVGIGHLMGSYYCSELTCTLLFNTYIGHKIILYITSYRYLTCDEVKACMYVSRFSLHFILLNKQAKRNGAASIKNKHSTQTQRENDTVFCLKIRPVGSNKPSQSQSRVSPVGKTRQKNKTGNEVIKCPVTFIDQLLEFLWPIRHKS